MKSILLLFLFSLPFFRGYSDLMTCNNYPTMCSFNMNLGKMGTCRSSYSTNQIFVDLNAVVGNKGVYTPGSTIQISMVPFSGQLVFQANNGAIFQGSLGSRNKNGILSGCSSVSRYQMYSSSTALLKMPNSGTVTIECNFASSSGSGSTKMTVPVVLTPSLTIINTMIPSRVPLLNPSKRPSMSPTIILSKPSTRIPSKVPFISLTLSPIAVLSKIPTRIPTKVPFNSLSFPPSRIPTKIPTKMPSKKPSITPSLFPTLFYNPSVHPISYIKDTSTPSNSPIPISSGMSIGYQIFYVIGILVLIVFIIESIIIVFMFYHYNTRINTITREPEESKEDNDISDIYNDPDHPKEESDEEDHELPPLESDKLMRKSENIDKKGIRDILTRKLSVGERHSYKSTTNKVNPMYYS